MRVEIAFTENADTDLSSIALWYENKQPGLGLRFIEEVLEAVEDIARMPLIYPNKFENTREKLMRKFPYLIIYTFETDFVFIHRIFPCKKNPESKYKIK